MTLVLVYNLNRVKMKSSHRYRKAYHMKQHSLVNIGNYMAQSENIRFQHNYENDGEQFL